MRTLKIVVMSLDKALKNWQLCVQQCYCDQYTGTSVRLMWLHLHDLLLLRTPTACKVTESSSDCPEFEIRKQYEHFPYFGVEVTFNEICSLY